MIMRIIIIQTNTDYLIHVPLDRASVYQVVIDMLIVSGLLCQSLLYGCFELFQ